MAWLNVGLFVSLVKVVHKQNFFHFDILLFTFPFRLWKFLKRLLIVYRFIQT